MMICTMSIPAGLQRGEPETTTPGMGHVTVGLLFWSESNEKPAGGVMFFPGPQIVNPPAPGTIKRVEYR
jgi:hypothetical protein